MIIKGMEHFQRVCKEKLLEWYNNRRPEEIEEKNLSADDVYIVWSCKTLQNYKALASTTVRDGIYAEYTYNGDRQELYEDVYKKLTNTVIREE